MIGETKRCVVAYLPPIGVGHGKVFLENMRKFPTDNELLLYSDSKASMGYGEDVIPCDSPDKVRTDENKFAVNNFVFLTGLSFAIARKFTHLLYIEADSRVGVKGWDSVLYEEFFKKHGAKAGGSLACYNPCNAGVVEFERVSELVSKSNTYSGERFGMKAWKPPIRLYGNRSAADKAGFCLFPNGSISIYEIEWLLALFGNAKIGQMSRSWKAFDMQIGLTAFEKHGVNVFNQMVHFKRSWSVYGDVLDNETERLHRLRTGISCATHQVKTWETV